MEKLTVEQRDIVKKMSTERLRAKLVKLEFDEEVIFATERPGLLDMLAEHMVNPPPEVSVQVTNVGELQL